LAEPETVAEACRAVLLAGDPIDKVKTARRVARRWRRGKLAIGAGEELPAEPSRPAEPELLPPNRMPRRGRGGSERGRIALLHALAHIEFVAIDLAFDMAARFAGDFPRAFVDDWIGVGADEAMHFALLDRRLRSLGSRYGAMPAHAGLWESAQATAHDPLARLAVVPMVLEARGLDVTPETIARFETAGDPASARILARILTDEIRHVRAGTRWFEWSCAECGLAPESQWRDLVTRYFRGRIKAPFNDSAREAAGLTREYYEALAQEGSIPSELHGPDGGGAAIRT
jgi:uncharacterized ferritin-like protein (DUF455 family)